MNFDAVGQKRMRFLIAQMRAFKPYTVDVKALLVHARISQAEIAAALRVRPSTVSAVVSGLRVSARIRRHIAKALGVSVADLWPNRRRVA